MGSDGISRIGKMDVSRERRAAPRCVAHQTKFTWRKCHEFIAKRKKKWIEDGSDNRKWVISIPPFAAIHLSPALGFLAIAHILPHKMKWNKIQKKNRNKTGFSVFYRCVRVKGLLLEQRQSHHTLGSIPFYILSSCLLFCIAHRVVPLFPFALDSSFRSAWKGFTYNGERVRCALYFFLSSSPFSTFPLSTAEGRAKKMPFVAHRAAAPENDRKGRKMLLKDDSKYLNDLWIYAFVTRSSCVCVCVLCADELFWLSPCCVCCKFFSFRFIDSQ